MGMRMILAALTSLSLLACSQPAERGSDAPRRIISLDYCADQYVLKFADREDIAALSPDADKHFSYMRAAAKGLPTVRPRAANILTLKPDLVVRSYGGGPGITDFLSRVGVPVVQVGYPQTIGEVHAEVLRMGSELGQPEAAKTIAVEMDRRLAKLTRETGKNKAALYMTPAGVTSGEGTLVHELLLAAGLDNFQDRSGWNPLPLERLAYETPDLVAAAFFESKTNFINNWSAARHPVVQTQLNELPVVPLEGAWTSCGGWFLLDAVEALARAEGARP